MTEPLALPNGRHIAIRELRRCESNAVRRLFERLSPRARYFRFLSPIPALPESLVTLLACPNGSTHVSLIAEDADGAERSVVGLANFGAIDAHCAEVGLVVQDDWQRQYVGTLLAGQLLRAAESRGYHRFVAHVLPENAPIKQLLARVGRVVSTTFDGGVVEVGFVSR